MKKNKFGGLSIRLRLSLTFTGLLLALLLALGFSLYFIVSQTVHNRLDTTLKNEVDATLGQQAHYPDSPLVLPGKLINPATGDPMPDTNGNQSFQTGLRVERSSLYSSMIIYNPDGTVMADADGGPISNSELAKAALAARGLPEGEGIFSQVAAPTDPATPGVLSQFKVYARPIFGLSDPKNEASPKIVFGMVVNTVPDDDAVTLLNSMSSVLLISLPVAVILSFLLASLVAWRALRPIKAISETATQISVSNLNHRIGLKSRDELGQLAQTFDKMVERLQTSFGRQRRFVADASHELRTPLAVIEAEATLMLKRPRDAAEYRRALELVADESGRMRNLIEDLLTLARADSGEVELRPRMVALDDLATEAASRISRLANQKGQRLHLNMAEEVWLMADPEVLDRLLFNLMSNAVKYTQEGGSIWVNVKRLNHSEALFEVVDNGPGISPEHIPFLFDRFYKVDRARTRKGSSGLGLAIAQWAAQAHGGRIEVRSQVGRGATFAVILPLPQQADNSSSASMRSINRPLMPPGPPLQPNSPPNPRPASGPIPQPGSGPLPPSGTNPRPSSGSIPQPGPNPQSGPIPPIPNRPGPR